MAELVLHVASLVHTQALVRSTSSHSVVQIPVESSEELRPVHVAPIPPLLTGQLPLPKHFVCFVFVHTQQHSVLNESMP